MYKAVLFLLLFLPVTAMAQKALIEKSIDEKNGSVVYKGYFYFRDLYTEPTFDWMREGTDAYEPDQTVLKDLAPLLKRYTLLVFMGSWCGDSKELLPQLYSVLDKCRYPLADIKIYGLDRAKTSGTGLEKSYGITNVPTIIVLDGKKEKGRITESVDNSMEADLLAIVKTSVHKK